MSKYALLIHGSYFNQWLDEIEKQVNNFKYDFYKVVLVSYTSDLEEYKKVLEKIKIKNLEIVTVKDVLNPGFFNINRQIVTVRAGLEKIDDNAFVFKLRNDQSCDFNKITKYFNGTQIITTNCYTRKDRLYHPSDMLLCAKADLLKKYYSLPLFEKTHLMVELDNIKYCMDNPDAKAIKYCPEIFLCTHYLKLNNWDVKDTQEDSFNALKKYFIVLNSWNISFKSKKPRGKYQKSESLILPQYYQIRPFQGAMIESVTCYSQNEFSGKVISIKDIFYISFSKFVWFIEEISTKKKVNKLLKMFKAVYFRVYKITATAKRRIIQNRI